MPGAVKRGYRQEQAAATRDRIAGAARRLFAQRGYRGTTMEAIAAEAGVAPRTVYASFSAKREILSAICDTWLAEAGALPLLDQTLQVPDTVQRMLAVAHWLRNLYDAGFDVVQLFEGASAEDEATRDLLRGKLAGRNQAQDRLIASFEDELVVPLERAQAIYRALAAPGIYQELAIESGWGADGFEDWLAGVLCRQLLGVEPPPGRG